MSKIAQVIQYEGDNSTLVWKHPCEDFNSMTQLIVHESQEAIFFLNGQAMDLFGPGRHTLETQNIPMLGHAFKEIVNNKTPFHCEVYFINKAVSMGIKWGTDSRVHFVDPITGLPFDIGASGEINIQVSDSRKLLVSLMGTGTELTTRETISNGFMGTKTLSDPAAARRTLQSCFRAPLMTQIKSYLASTIQEQRINILEADAHLASISAALQARIAPVFAEYGLSVQQFYVTTLSLPEDDRNFKDMKALIARAYLGVKTEQVSADIAEAEQRRKLIEGQTEAQLKILQAQTAAETTRLQGMAEAEVMRAKGYTEKDLLDTQVQKAYAEGMGKFGSNISAGGGGGGGGGVAMDMVGMMTGMKMAETMFSKMDTALSGANATPAQPTAQPAAQAAGTWSCSCGETGNTKNFCMNCGQPRPTAKFCPNCGEKLGGNSNFCPNCGEKL